MVTALASTLGWSLTPNKSSHLKLLEDSNLGDKSQESQAQEWQENGNGGTHRTWGSCGSV